MQLTKKPETEMDFWQAIESLGGFIYYTGHDIRSGFIKDSQGTIQKEMEEAKRISEELVNELHARFNVIPPDRYPRRESDGTWPVPPKGKRWYWEWYEAYKREYHEAEFKKLICSACALCEGIDEFMNGYIPCSVFPGMLYRLRAPRQCGMVAPQGEWTRKQLLAKIRTQGGVEASRQFLKKEKELR